METKPAKKLELEEFADKVYDNLFSMAVAQNLIRKPEIAKNRYNRTTLEIRISSVPKAYGLQREIIDASKDGIYAAKHGKEEAVDQSIESAKKAWLELLNLPMPAHKLHQFVSAAGQELVELMAVAYLAPALRGNFDLAMSNFGRLPMPEDPELKIPYEAWLAGLQDAVTELAKLMNDILIQDRPSLEEYEKIVTRMHELSRAMYEFLEQFENENKAVVDNSYHRGQSYKDKLRRVWIYISERLQPLVMEVQRRNLQP